MELMRRPGLLYILGLAFLLFLAACMLDLVRRGFWSEEHDYSDSESDMEFYRPAIDMVNQQFARLASQSLPDPYLQQDMTVAYESRRSKPKYCRPKKHDPTKESPYKNNTVAVLIERRDTEELLPIIMHYVGNLPGWNFHIFHSDENRHRFNESPAILRMIAAGRLRMTRIPDKYQFQSHASVSQFLTDTWFWNSIKEEHVMIFQADAMLCSNLNRNIDDYLHYDYIGGPFWTPRGLNYNGGLSLRRRSKILAVLAAHDLPTKHWTRDWEDQWFSHHLAAFPGACLPSARTAAEFSVDLMWLGGSFGGHQVWKWHPPEKLREFEANCPELRLITTRKHMWRNGAPGWDGHI